MFALLFLSLLSFPAATLDEVSASLPGRGDGVFVERLAEGEWLFGVGRARYSGGESREEAQARSEEAVLQARLAVARHLGMQVGASRGVQKEGRIGEGKSRGREEQAKSIDAQTEAELRRLKTIRVVQVAAKSGRGGHYVALVGLPPQGGGEARVVWLTCAGTGESRAAAIRAALLEGVSQVYGTRLMQDQSLRKRFTQMREDDVTHSRSEQDLQSHSLSRTYGFVQEYRILSVRKTEDGRYEAEVRAGVVNPHRGLGAVMVLPMELPSAKAATLYPVAPQYRMSGAAVGRLCTRRLEQALAQRNQWLVLEAPEASLAQRASEKGVPVEYLRAGAVEADYLIRTVFSEARFSRAMRMDPKTKKFAPHYTMKLAFDFRAVEARGGVQCGNGSIAATLSHEKIEGILAAHKGQSAPAVAAALLEALLDQAVPDICARLRLEPPER